MRDDLLEQLAQLNPVPDPDRLVVPEEPELPLDPTLRDLLEQARTARGRPLRAVTPASSEESEMPTFTPPRQQEPPSEDRTARRRWLVAVGAAAAVLVAVAITAGVLTLGSDEPTPPTVTDEGGDAAPAEVQLAQAYFEARNAYDADHAMELVAGGFMTSEYPSAFGPDATMSLVFDAHRAYGYSFTDGHCDDPVQRGEGRSTVKCEYALTTELQRVTGYPAVPVTFRFTIVDGAIFHIAYGGDGPFVRDVFDPWLAYLENHDPDLHRLIEPRHREEEEDHRAGLARLPEAIQEYGSWLEAQED
jgi:hypothetical protein